MPYFYLYTWTLASGENHPFARYFRFSPAHAYLPRFEFSVVPCGRPVPLSTWIHCSLFHYTCILGISQYLPYTRQTLRVILMSNCSPQPKGVVVKPYLSKGNFRLKAGTKTCFLFSTLAEAHYLPVNGIISCVLLAGSGSLRQCY